MQFNIHPGCGNIRLGLLQFAWGSPDNDLDLPGFFTAGFGRWSLEFGDVDQGVPGIYIVEYVLGEPVPYKTLWQKRS